MAGRASPLLVALCSAVLWCSAAQAQEENPGQELFGTLFRGIGEGLAEEFKRKLADERNDANATKVKGYCQVWRDGALAVQEKCKLKIVCIDDRNCVHTHKWPSKRKTQVVYRDEQPIGIGDKQSERVMVGEDYCARDGESSAFCFTTVEQQRNLVVEFSQPKTVVVATLEPTATPSVEPASSTVTEDNAIVTKPLDPLPPPVPGETVAPTTSMNELLDKFVLAVEEADSADSKQKRCSLGSELVKNHGHEIDAELKSQIEEVLRDEQCAV